MWSRSYTKDSVAPGRAELLSVPGSPRHFCVALATSRSAVLRAPNWLVLSPVPLVVDGAVSCTAAHFERYPILSVPSPDSARPAAARTPVLPAPVPLALGLS